MKVGYEIKKIIKLIIFLTIFFAINGYLNFITSNPVNYIRWQNHDLTGTGEKYDLIAIGPSDCRSGFDPDVADEILGIKTFNYGQNGANYSEGLKASVDNVLRYQNPSCIVLYIPTYEMKQGKAEPPTVYMRSEPYIKSPFSRLYYYIVSGLHGGALYRLSTWMFFIEDENYDIDYVKGQVKAYAEIRKQDDYKLYSSHFFDLKTPDLKYHGKGYYNFVKGVAEEYDFDNDASIPVDQRGVYVEETEDKVGGTGYRGICKILSKLKKRGIRTVVVAGPNSIPGIYKELLYYSRSQALSKLAEQYDCEYYDLNMLKKEIWRPMEGEWNDMYHLLDNGVARFTEVLCQILLDAEAGKDTAHYFYQNWDEFVKSIDEIITVGIDTETSDSVNRLDAFSVCGPSVESEYRWVRYDEGDETREELLYDYGETDSIMIDTDEDTVLPEGWNIRVYGRNINDRDNIRYTNWYH